MKTNTSITIYNKYYDSDSGINVYQLKVIPAVEWENRKAVNVIRSGGDRKADQAVIYVPRINNVDDYLSPKTWKALEDKTGYWTLQPGDVIVRGTLIQELDESYTTTDLENDYDNVMQITSIDTFDMGSLSMQHWKVGIN